jgi:hypothetical protein
MTGLAILCALLAIVMSDAFATNTSKYTMQRICAIMLLITQIDLVSATLPICLALLLLYAALYDIISSITSPDITSIFNNTKFSAAVNAISKLTKLQLMTAAKVYIAVKILLCIIAVFLVYSVI